MLNIKKKIIEEISANKTVPKTHVKTYKVIHKILLSIWFYVYSIPSIMERFVFEKCITICSKMY